MMALTISKRGNAAACGMNILKWDVLRHAQMNLMFSGECVAVSLRTGEDAYCTSQSQILAYVSEYMTQIRIFIVYCHLNK